MLVKQPQVTRGHPTTPLHVIQVLLLDEVTVDMDVVARLDLLDFFRYVHFL